MAPLLATVMFGSKVWGFVITLGFKASFAFFLPVPQTPAFPRHHDGTPQRQASAGATQSPATASQAPKYPSARPPHPRRG